MEGPRTPREGEKDSVIQFLDRHLRPDSDWSIKDEYPTTFTDRNLHNIHIIENDNEVLSHAATRYVLLKTPQVVLKIAAIGSVVTNENYRKQGHSHNLLNRCLEKAQEQNADLAILWSDLFSFYRKLGFEVAGHELSFMIDQPIGESEPQGLTIREGANVSPEAILRVFNKHSVTSVRSAEDIRKYLNIPNSRVYTAWDSKGFLQGYAVEGKGADLDGYIHEWGGGISKVIPLINHIQKTQNRPITLICPNHATGLINALEQRGVQHHNGQLGMIRILNFDSIKGKILRHARALGVSGLNIEQSGEEIRMNLGEHELNFASQRHFTRFIFGPDTHLLTAKLPDDAHKVFTQLFPLNLWIWGWDSI